MKTNHHYKILQVSPTATSDDIKRAFRKLAHLYHPDKTKNDTHLTAQFEQIKTAYEVLMDASLRSAYDATLFAGFAGKGKSVAVDAASYFDKVRLLQKELEQKNKNNIDYDWLFLWALSLLRSRGIQDAIIQKGPLDTLHALLQLIQQLPYRELKQLDTDIQQIFNEDAVRKNWLKFLLEKKYTEHVQKATIWLVLLVAVAAVYMMMRAPK